MSDASVRFGILSTAQIGGRLITALRESTAGELVAIASRDAATLDAFAEKQGLAGVRRHVGYEALLADPEVDAVYCPLPNALHAEWAIRAAEAGKHVLCEKPLARDAAECLAMIAAAKQAGVVLMEAFQFRHHPAIRRVRELLDAGTIGDVRLLRASFSFFMEDTTNIRYSHALAGGATMDVGCYAVNLARYVAGEEPATAYATATFGDTGVDESLYGTLSFPSGFVAQFDCSLHSAGRAAADILGTKGVLTIERPWNPDPERAVLCVNGETVAVEHGGNAYQAELEVFCRTVRSGAALPIPPEDAARNMAAVTAILESARSGQPVAVAPVDAVSS